MSTRRDFISTSLKAATLTGLAPVIPSVSADVSNALTEGGLTSQAMARSPLSRRFKPKQSFGLGGVAIGNAFRPTTDEQAPEAMQAAWNTGVRYFDTSPWYGLGLSERRFGHFLHNQKREDYILSTKVGRLLNASGDVPKTMWVNPSPF